MASVPASFYRVVATSRSIKPVADKYVVTVQGDVAARVGELRDRRNLLHVDGGQSAGH